MDLALNNLQRLICHKTNQPTKQTNKQNKQTNRIIKCYKLDNWDKPFIRVITFLPSLLSLSLSLSLSIYIYIYIYISMYKSILHHGFTTWTLTKSLEKKTDGNYARMLWAILKKFWRQHPTKRQLYGHLPPITKTIKFRRTTHAGHCWRSRDEQKQDDQLERTYTSSMRMRNVALRTCQKRWTIGKSGERGSGIFVLVAWHDDDDDVDKFTKQTIVTLR